MPSPTTRRLPTLLLATLALASCGQSWQQPPATSPTAVTPAAQPATPAPAALIPVGPGPLPQYAVQPQPAPGTCHYRYDDGGYPLRDPACTPGATNPRVTQNTLGSTICRPGYSASIRPPGSITRHEKRANATAYAYTGTLRTAEYDHLLPLALGGDPNDPRNLWVEPNDNPRATNTSNGKDAVENAAHAAVCSGRLTLADAQQQIATDWPSLGRSLGVLP